jgi:uncharacterized protein
MPLLLNIRHLQSGPITLRGELDLEDLDIQALDELIRPAGSLRYELTAEHQEKGILLQGCLELPLTCECARCLQSFGSTVVLKDWACLLPYEGEDQVSLHNDCVDLTPYLREDTLLALPQRPLCRAECRGLPEGGAGESARPGGALPPTEGSSAWSELDKLKF